MADACCTPPPLNLDRNRGNAGYRRVLWAVLGINAAMFLVEIGAGLAAGSASLQADALDFLGDAANYSISLFVVGMALRYRASAALVKGITPALMEGVDGRKGLADVVTVWGSGQININTVGREVLRGLGLSDAEFTEIEQARRQTPYFVAPATSWPRWRSSDFW